MTHRKKRPRHRAVDSVGQGRAEYSTKLASVSLSALLQRIHAVALGIGATMLIWIYGKGNQQIFALPLAVWLTTLFWPSNVCEENNYTEKKQGNRETRRWQSHPIVVFLSKKIWFLTLPVWICVIVGVWSGFSVSTSIEEIVKKLDKADTIAEQGHVEKGLALLKSLEIPDNMPIQKARKHHNCGVFLVRLRRPLEASKQFRLALKYDQADVQAAHMIAALALGQRQYDEAARMITALSYKSWKPKSSEE